MKRIAACLVLSAVLFSAPVFAVEQSQKVEIFVTAWCPYCVRLESFLKENGVPYTRYDVEADEKAAELFFRLGGEGVPLTRAGSVVIRGFDPEAVLEASKALQK